MKVKIDFDKAVAKQATRVVGKFALSVLGIATLFGGFNYLLIALFEASVVLGVVAVLLTICLAVWILTYICIKADM